MMHGNDGRGRGKGGRGRRGRTQRGNNQEWGTQNMNTVNSDGTEEANMYSYNRVPVVVINPSTSGGANQVPLNYPAMVGASWTAGLTNPNNRNPFHPMHSSDTVCDPRQINQRIAIEIPMASASASLPYQVDSISRRTIGSSNASYHQSGQREEPTRKRKVEMARPLPDPSRMRAVRMVTKKISIPLRWETLAVKMLGYEGFMKKITHFHLPPLAVTLPGDTFWGGIYDDGVFLTGSAQEHIAKRSSELSVLGVNSKEWCNISGCFVEVSKKTVADKLGLKYSGKASLKPVFQPCQVAWRELPANFVYIPNPAEMMTTVQMEIYATLVQKCVTPAEVDTKPMVVTLSDSSPENIAGERAEEKESNESTSAGIVGDSSLDYSDEYSCYDRTGLDYYENISDDPPSNSSTWIPERQTDVISASDAIQIPACIGSMRCDTESEEYMRQSISSRQLHDRSISIPTRRTCIDHDNVSSLNLRDGHSIDNKEELTFELLKDAWMMAEGELAEFKQLHPLQLVVDLGELYDEGVMFWQCFDSIMLEESESATGVIDDIRFLKNRRILHFGLTSRMVDEQVCRLLGATISLSPYLRADVQKHFHKAAMPSWHSWENLGILLDENPLNMEQVEVDKDWILGLFEKTPDSYLKRRFSDTLISTMQSEYREWMEHQRKSTQICRSTDHQQLHTYFQMEKAVGTTYANMIVQNISYKEMQQFCILHAHQPAYKLHVVEGKEVDAFRHMCDDVLQRQIVFPDFNVQYTSISRHGAPVVEDSTIDFGGPTRRFLGELWSHFFDESREYRNVFERPPNAEVCHLMSDFSDNVHTRRDVCLAGQMFFLMILKKQRMSKPMTMATIAIAMGKKPQRDSIFEALENGRPDMYVEDYLAFRPLNHSRLFNFLNSSMDSRQESLEYIMSDMPEDCLGFTRLNPTLSDAEFRKQTHKLIAGVIYTTFFTKCARISTLFQEGFFSLINTVKSAFGVREEDRKRVLRNLFKDTEIEGMRAFYSASQAITSDEFLSKSIFTGSFPLDLKQFFIEVVTNLTGVEVYRLYVYITDDKYNKGTPCKIVCNRKASLQSLPCSHTCTATLDIPYYSSVKMLAQKLDLATYSRAYGLA